MDPLLNKDILNRLELLSTEDQKKVLDFTKILVEKKMAGVPGMNLLEFAGTWEKSELTLMRKAIEDDCEKVDVHEW